MIRDHLTGALLAQMVDALGSFVEGELVAIQAWRRDRDPAVMAIYEDNVWLSVVLAVKAGQHRRGYGIGLKRELIRLGQAARIVAITSIVAWSNTPMIELNKALGGSVRAIPTDVGPDLEACRCVVPL